MDTAPKTMATDSKIAIMQTKQVAVGGVATEEEDTRERHD
jgi:hypothetical protein